MSRNQLIEDTIIDLSDETLGLHALLEVSLGRVLARLADTDLEKAIRSDMERLFHIRDWLKASLLGNATWLARTDDKGRPVKIMKCGSVDALAREADEWMRRETARIGIVELDGTHEAVEFHLADGWRIVRLLTPEALDAESKAMQHCVGHGSYDGHLGSKGYRILSLRDPFGKPHATLEIAHGVLHQMQGKQNRGLNASYANRVAEYLTKGGVEISRHVIDLIKDVHGVVYHVDDLPCVLETVSDLNLDSSSHDVRLPTIIRTEGYLVLSGERFLTTPEEITAGKGLSVSRGALDDLPERLSVAGYLNIPSILASKLPKGFTVDGTLSCHSFYSSDTDDDEFSLPSGLVVTGLLNLQDAKIASLPQDIRFGSINISHSKIEELDLDCFLPRQDGEINELRANMSKLKRLKGAAHIDSVSIVGTPMSEFPEGLTVRGLLDISLTAISTIPSRVEPRFTLRAEHCNIESIPENLTCREANFRHSTITLPPRLNCAGDILCSRATIKTVPKEMRGAKIDFSYATMDSLPTKLEAVTLDIVGTGIDEISAEVSTRTLRLTPHRMKIDKAAVVSESVVFVVEKQPAAKHKSYPVDKVRYRLRVAPPFVRPEQPEASSSDRRYAA